MAMSVKNAVKNLCDLSLLEDEGELIPDPFRGRVYREGDQSFLGRWRNRGIRLYYFFKKACPWKCVTREERLQGSLEQTEQVIRGEAQVALRALGEFKEAICDLANGELEEAFLWKKQVLKFESFYVQLHCLHSGKKNTLQKAEGVWKRILGREESSESWVTELLGTIEEIEKNRSLLLFTKQNVQLLPPSSLISLMKGETRLYEEQKRTLEFWVKQLQKDRQTTAEELYEALQALKEVCIEGDLKGELDHLLWHLYVYFHENKIEVPSLFYRTSREYKQWMKATVDQKKPLKTDRGLEKIERPLRCWKQLESYALPVEEGEKSRTLLLAKDPFTLSFALQQSRKVEQWSSERKKRKRSALGVGVGVGMGTVLYRDPKGRYAVVEGGKYSCEPQRGKGLLKEMIQKKVSLKSLDFSQVFLGEDGGLICTQPLWLSEPGSIVDYEALAWQISGGKVKLFSSLILDLGLMDRDEWSFYCVLVSKFAAGEKVDAQELSVLKEMTDPFVVDAGKQLIKSLEEGLLKVQGALGWGDEQKARLRKTIARVHVANHLGGMLTEDFWEKVKEECVKSNG